MDFGRLLPSRKPMRTGKHTTLYIDKPGDILVDLEHEVFEFKNFMNQKCIKDKSYNDDIFTIEEFDRKAMNDYGWIQIKYKFSKSKIAKNKT